MSNEIHLFGNSNPNTGNKDPKKIVLTIASLAVIIAVLIVAIKLASKPASDDTGDGGEKLSSKLTEKLSGVFVVDNDIKNASNSKTLAVSGDYLFYTDSKGLYRVNKDGSGKLELDTGQISNINVYKDGLYYTKTEATDGSSTYSNKKHQIIRISFDGKKKNEIHTYDCQRISSMLVVNEVVLYQPIVFVPDGGTNEHGESTGSFQTNYVAVSIDGKDATRLHDDTYHSRFAIKYPYNQSELDALLGVDYPETVVKTSRYFIDDTMYFDTQSIQDPKTIRIFSISKANNVLNLIGEHIPDTSSTTPVSLYTNGFVYDGEFIYYVLTERRGTEEKNDLYKIDLNSNNLLFVQTLN